jgi:hypothetical protein
MLQRYALEDFLGQQKGKRDNSVVFYRIRRKIKVPQEIRTRIFVQSREHPELGEAVFAPYEDAPVELETEEVRKLVDAFDKSDIVAAQLDWIEPIMEQLR